MRREDETHIKIKEHGSKEDASTGLVVIVVEVCVWLPDNQTNDFTLLLCLLFWQLMREDILQAVSL